MKITDLLELNPIRLDKIRHVLATTEVYFGKCGLLKNWCDAFDEMVCAEEVSGNHLCLLFQCHDKLNAQRVEIEHLKQLCEDQEFAVRNSSAAANEYAKLLLKHGITFPEEE